MPIPRRSHFLPHREKVLPMCPARCVIYVSGRALRHITIQRFLAAKCIGRLVITPVPVLIGAGIALFGPVPCDIRLRHINTRSYSGGLVQSEYGIDAEEPR